MDKKILLLGIGVGSVLGVALDRWVVPKIQTLRARALAEAPEAPPEVAEDYHGWGVYRKEPPAGYHPAKPPAEFAEIGRRREPGAETPSGEALGGF